MKRKSIGISIAIYVAISSIGAVVVPSVAMAASCGGANTSIIDCGGKTGQSAIFDILSQGIKIMTAIIGVVAVGVTAYGGILYAQSGSSPEMMKKAKDIWVNVVIGLIAYAFLVAITNFLIPGGVF